MSFTISSQLSKYPFHCFHWMFITWHYVLLLWLKQFQIPNFFFFYLCISLAIFNGGNSQFGWTEVCYAFWAWFGNYSLLHTSTSHNILITLSSSYRSLPLNRSKTSTLPPPLRRRLRRGSVWFPAAAERTGGAVWFRWWSVWAGFFYSPCPCSPHSGGCVWPEETRSLCPRECAPLWTHGASGTERSGNRNKHVNRYVK